MKTNILLESGTGEVEIIEFLVNNQSYAINVLKVKGIIQLDEIVPLPQSAPQIIGMTNIRGEMNVVIDLKRVLHNQSTDNYKSNLGLLCEFNGTIIVFLVEEVKDIVKVTWEEIKQTNQVKDDVFMIGSILRDERIIILLDFESITMAAKLGQSYEKQQQDIASGPIVKRDTKLVFVEDSRAIREMTKCSLKEAGYENVRTFENGKDAYDYIETLKSRLGENFMDEIDLLITDIEMPGLDGYTLTRKIKEDPMLEKLPIIIFSSLITEELKHKGQAVGANIQISKPSIKELIIVLDQYEKGELL